MALGVTLNYEFSAIMSVVKRIPLAALQHIVDAPKSLRRYGQTAVDNLRRNSGQKANLFATMLVHSDAAEDPELTDEDVRIEASLFLIAGADSTAITLTYLVWAVLKRPELQARLEEEIAGLGGCEFDDVTLEKLPLLNAVVEESLRLYGALCGNLSRVVPLGGAYLSGFQVPAGVEVETQAFTLHRDPDVFPDPLKYALPLFQVGEIWR